MVFLFIAGIIYRNHKGNILVPDKEHSHLCVNGFPMSQLRRRARRHGRARHFKIVASLSYEHGTFSRVLL